MQASLRVLAQQLRSGPALAPGPGASPYQRTIQAIEPNTFFDLTCKVCPKCVKPWHQPLAFLPARRSDA